MVNPRGGAPFPAQAPILFLKRPIDSIVDGSQLSSANIITFCDHPAPANDWLALRNACLAKPTQRPWNATNFTREFLSQAWWTPEQMWFARATDEVGVEQTVGSITLALRRQENREQAHLHWLLVHPSWRRNRIALDLLRVAERSAHARGHDCLFAETLATWTEAVAFYRATGFRSDKH